MLTIYPLESLCRNLTTLFCSVHKNGIRVHIGVGVASRSSRFRVWENFNNTKSNNTKKGGIDPGPVTQLDMFGDICMVYINEVRLLTSEYWVI